MLLWSRVFSLMSSKCQKCPSLIAVVFFVAAPNRICLAPCFFFSSLREVSIVVDGGKQGFLRFFPGTSQQVDTVEYHGNALNEDVSFRGCIYL